jgi:hypothetical protein
MISTNRGDRTEFCHAGSSSRPSTTIALFT